MKLTVFTDSDEVRASFSMLEGDENYTIEFYSVTQVLKQFKKAVSGECIFFDVGRISVERSRQIIHSLSARKDVIIALIDIKRRLDDVGTLFHEGISDYLSRNILTEKITVERLERMKNFKAPLALDCPEVDTGHSGREKIFENYKHVNPDWSNVEAGEEYTFLFVHIYFDNYKEIEANYSRDHAVRMVTRMNSYLQSVISEYSGIVWMWMERAGLMLFPFDRRGVTQLELLFRLMFNRKIITLENGFRNELSYRFSVHIGNTVYEEPGNTGAVVSETVNAIFHLGNKYTKAKSIYLTEEVKPFVPERMEGFLSEAGVYEGRDIFSIKLPNI